MMTILRKMKNNLLRRYEFSPLAIKHRSRYDNIYYCCTQKTASQWFRKILSEPIIYQNTGLKTIVYNQLPPRLQDAKFDQAFPKRTFVTNLYIDYLSYQSIPKPKKFKTFFILRDPRDIVVSWYFSVKYSHPENALIPQYRKKLNKLSLNDGLKYSIESLEQAGLFYAQKTWMTLNAEGIKIFRYEDFVKDNYRFLKQLFSYLDVEISEIGLKNLVDRNKFKNFSGNRDPGTEDVNHHYRKGIPGDWMNYFDREISDFFKTATGDLLKITDYCPTRKMGEESSPLGEDLSRLPAWNTTGDLATESTT
jgi:hypothetical protein